MIKLIMHWLALHAYELTKTLRSFVSAVIDLIDLHLSFHIKKRPGTFAFLVHPRTSEFYCPDVYGNNDIFRPFPMLNWLNYFMEPDKARAFILRFAKWINPITLSHISVRLSDGTKRRGYLLSTVRTPEQLLGTEARETRTHLSRLFDLAGSKGVERVGLGALLPAMTKYGALLQTDVIDHRPAVSTGHAYTGYVIVEYLRLLTARRNLGSPVARVAIMGAAGSTGKAVLRMLIHSWEGPVHLELVLIDVPKKEIQLRALINEVRECGKFVNAHAYTNPEMLRDCGYVVVVTNAVGSTIQPEHLKPGTVVIDDSQPRNTSPALAAHGVHVLDVLARVPGLDVGFDFGFQTKDKSVTFTCLAETVLAAAVGETQDLAIGEVTLDTIKRVVEIARKGERLGLVGPLPFFSFGRELSDGEIDRVLEPQPEKSAPTGE